MIENCKERQRIIYKISAIKKGHFQLHEYMTPDEVMSVFHTPPQLGKQNNLY